MQISLSRCKSRHLRILRRIHLKVKLIIRSQLGYTVIRPEAWCSSAVPGDVEYGFAARSVSSTRPYYPAVGFRLASPAARIRLEVTPRPRRDSPHRQSSGLIKSTCTFCMNALCITSQAVRSTSVFSAISCFSIEDFWSGERMLELRYHISTYPATPATDRT